MLLRSTHPMKTMSRTLLTSLARLCAPLLVLAVCLFASAARADDDFLDPQAAFKFSARMDGSNTALVTYQIADGYYMYRERFHFSATGAKLGEPQIPAGKLHFDENFGKNVETYRNSVTVRIPVEGNGPFTLTSVGQGCADKGLCYPPQEATAQLVAAGGAAAAGPTISVGGQGNADGASSALSQPSGNATAPAAPAPADTAAHTAPVASEPALAATASAPAAPAAIPSSPAAPAAVPRPSELSGISSILQGGSLLAIVPAFILLGLGLAFTPCVLPMVPILSSIIVGEGGQVSRMRGLVLSLAYALGMAIIYTALGVAAGLIGEGLSAALQNKWVLGGFALLMILMSLSMFGFYELQLPGSFQTKLASASGRQKSGKLAGVFAMGALSALIVGPCVAAPLAGALVYISQTRDVLIGGAALFSMAVGMSIPLLLVGVSAGSLLPRAGVWMDAVKRFFGVLMLAMALWLASPVLPGLVQMLLWTGLLVGYGAWLLHRKAGWISIAAGMVFAVLGAVELVGAASGGRDVLDPLARLRGGGEVQEAVLAFKRVKSVGDLDAVLANTGGKTVMLDFYADWCVSCKEMERLTFPVPGVKTKLANTILLQADVTANDAADKALLKRFGLFGPPGIILFDRAGREIADSRVIGYQNADKFLASLQKLD
jgi:thioredoxin:protein disulfide reductase